MSIRYTPFHYLFHVYLFLLFCCSTIFLPSGVSAQEQFEWAQSMDGEMAIDALATDRNGNVYVAGHYSGSFILGDTSVTRLHGQAGMVIAKFSTTGSSSPIWMRTLEGVMSINRIHSIGLDTLGHLYIAGNYSSRLRADTTTVLDNPSYPNPMIFTARYDTSGRLDRVRTTGIPFFYKTPPAMAIDPVGTIYLMGGFIGTIPLNAQDTLRNSSNGIGIGRYLVKYDLSDSLLWSKSAGGADSDYAGKIALDRLGNIYIAGFTGGSLELFDTIPIRQYKAFVARYNSDGSPQWIAYADSGHFAAVTSLSTDSEGNVFVAGEYYGTMKFGTHVLSSRLNTCFIAAYTASGRSKWAADFERGKDPGSISNSAMACDNRGNVYITAAFRGKVTIGNTILKARKEQIQDILLAKYSPQGYVIRASQCETANGYSNPTAITTDTTGRLYLAGTFYDSLSIGTIKVYGHAFLARTVASRQVSSNIQVSVFPNPSARMFVVRATNIPDRNVEITLYDLTGRLILSRTYQTADPDFVQQFTLPELTTGIYLLHLRAGTQISDVLVTIR